MLKFNITMNNGTILPKVILYKSKEMGDSRLRTGVYARYLLQSSTQTIYFSNEYVQGGLIPQNIKSYELIDDVEEIRDKICDMLFDYEIVDSRNIVNFILKNRNELVAILD